MRWILQFVCFPLGNDFWFGIIIREYIYRQAFGSFYAHSDCYGNIMIVWVIDIYCSTLRHHGHPNLPLKVCVDCLMLILLISEIEGKVVLMVASLLPISNHPAWFARSPIFLQKDGIRTSLFQRDNVWSSLFFVIHKKAGGCACIVRTCNLLL
jgi:hypothetical protein